MDLKHTTRTRFISSCMRMKDVPELPNELKQLWERAFPLSPSCEKSCECVLTTCAEVQDMKALSSFRQSTLWVGQLVWHMSEWLLILWHACLRTQQTNLWDPHGSHAYEMAEVFLLASKLHNLVEAQYTVLRDKVSSLSCCPKIVPELEALTIMLQHFWQTLDAQDKEHLTKCSQLYYTMNMQQNTISMS